MRTKCNRQKRVAGVILAAGMSTRMGTVKQLLMVEGKPLLSQVLINARSADCLTPLIIVLGHEAATIQQRIDFGADRVVIAADYRRGQSASLKAGLSAVPEGCDGVLFLLGDQPFICGEIVGKIMARFKRSDADIIIPTYGGKRGNPVLISRNLFGQLVLINSDAGARQLFKAFPDRILEIEVGPRRACLDIDTWDRYQALCRRDPNDF
jgi:molybdenum cofactor cytidylyltransferase